MIKFFRKIRQQLLKENKTGKYLKYAIGEIVLVVIGILLAVQVNNWNEKRKDRHDSTIELKTNLNSVSTSLASDSILIKDFSYLEFEFIISQLDTAISFVREYPNVNLSNASVFENILIQPLMDFTNSSLTAFINSKIYGDMDNLQFKEDLSYYDFMHRDDWDKDERVLEYLNLQIRPLINAIILKKGDNFIVNRDLIESNKIKIINDLSYLKTAYVKKQNLRLPYYLKWINRIRNRIIALNRSL